MITTFFSGGENPLLYGNFLGITKENLKYDFIKLTFVF